MSDRVSKAPKKHRAAASEDVKAKFRAALTYILDTIALGTSR